MYGSSGLRAYYGAGDYQRMSVGYRPGTYAAGGFFGKALKGLKKVSKVANAPLMAAKKIVNNPILKPFIGMVPGGSMLTTAVNIGAGAAQALSGGGTKALTSQLTKGAALSMLAPPGVVETLNVAQAARKRSRGKKKRRRRGYAAGDYGDDWVGRRPSRAKGTGRFLTKAGGRRRRRKQRGGRRARGRTVSFTTKSGKRVSFTPRKRSKSGSRRRRLGWLPEGAIPKADKHDILRFVIDKLTR